MQFWSTASTRKPKGWGAAACDLNVSDLDFSPAQCEADKSVPDKIRQQLQVQSLPRRFCRGDLNLLEFLSPGSYRLFSVSDLQVRHKACQTTYLLPLSASILAFCESVP